MANLLEVHIPMTFVHQRDNMTGDAVGSHVLHSDGLGRVVPGSGSVAYVRV